MTKKSYKKGALLSSIIALLLCFTMLIGTTFAWFTDSVSSGSNKIVAGNLDIQLLMWDGSAYVDISDSTDPIFGEGSIAQNKNAETLWEPGKTQVAYLAVKNAGSLALKYKVELNVTNDAKDLYKAMRYAITPDAKDGSVTSWAGNGTAVTEGTQPASEEVSLAVGATHYFALSVHMDELAGNEYQGGAVSFDMTVLATQDTVEEDSFNNQYDANAAFLQNNVSGDVNTTGSGYGDRVDEDEVAIYDQANIVTEGGGLSVWGTAIFNSGSIQTNSTSTSARHVFYVAGAEGAKGHLTINDGQFTFSPDNLTRKGSYLCAEGADATIIVNGGTFHKPSTRTAPIQALSGATVTIYGGKFAFDPSAFVAEGYQAVKGDDGYWTVSAK